MRVDVHHGDVREHLEIGAVHVEGDAEGGGDLFVLCAATECVLEPSERLRKIYLPMASRSILAGIKTSAVINIGTATLAALIGAGGLGEPILSGLNLNDHVTILKGAIPAAVLALLVQWSFDLLDRVLIPRGLRL